MGTHGQAVLALCLVPCRHSCSHVWVSTGVLKRQWCLWGQVRRTALAELLKGAAGGGGVEEDPTAACARIFDLSQVRLGDESQG